MNRTAIIAAIIASAGGLVAGLMIESFKEWVKIWLARRTIRQAIGAEISGVLIGLNFYILAATDVGSSQAVEAKYLDNPPRLESFDYYWQTQRDALLKLPEWDGYFHAHAIKAQ